MQNYRTIMKELRLGEIKKSFRHVTQDLWFGNIKK